MNKILPSNRVVIIGAGNVGSSAAYAILNQEIANEILMIDIVEDLAKAQVLDLQDSAGFGRGTELKYATYEDLKDGDIVVITCGAAQKEGQTRLELLSINAKIIREVLSRIKSTNKIVYILMVTNPVDVLTYIAIKESGLPENMVFGSGTFLDSIRLRGLIKQEIEVNSENIDAFILGEHGDSSFAVLSGESVDGIDLSKFLSSKRQDLEEKVRQKAYDIIVGKKATYYGIGSDIAFLCRTILRDEKRVMPLSILMHGEYGFDDVVLSVPVKLGLEGIERIPEINLNEQEKESLKKSAEVIKENILKCIG